MSWRGFYHNDNPDLPTLDPWMLQTKPPSERFVFDRNPYYFGIDPAGHQLPYIDQVTLTIADAKIEQGVAQQCGYHFVLYLADPGAIAAVREAVSQA